MIGRQGSGRGVGRIGDRAESAVANRGPSLRSPTRGSRGLLKRKTSLELELHDDDDDDSAATDPATAAFSLISKV